MVPQICGPDAKDFINILKTSYPSPVKHENGWYNDNSYCVGGLACYHAYRYLGVPIKQVPIPQNAQRNYWTARNYLSLRFPTLYTLSGFLKTMNPEIKNAFHYASIINTRNDDGHFDLAFHWLHAALIHGHENTEEFAWTESVLERVMRNGILRAKTHEFTKEERDFLCRIAESRIP